MWPTTAITKKIGIKFPIIQAPMAGGATTPKLVAAVSNAGGLARLFGVEILVRHFLENVKIPVIAAGGIMDAKGIVSALALGAEAVQMGTAFLSCHESGINFSYKDALLSATQDNTILTRVFSGKMARGLKNKFIERMQQHYQDDILDYPIQNSLTRSMRKEAEKQSNVDFMSMWAGQSVYLSQAYSAAELIKKLVNDVNVILKK